jgi:radical SAM protein with 4Fe4S-binding SPASM domain
VASVSKVRALNVVTTASCNLNCAYCYQNAKAARRMDWDTLRAAVELLMRSRQPEVRLVFSGGEPLLQLPLIRRAVDYAESIRHPDRRFRYVISTNGVLLDGAAVDFLAARQFDIQLSFDGVRGAQRFRGARTFPVLDGALDRIRRDHPAFYDDHLSVSLTLTSASTPFLADSVAYFMRKRVKEIAISPTLTHDDGWRKGHIRGLDRQFRRIFKASLTHYLASGEVPVVMFRRSRGASGPRPRRLTLCGVGRGEVLTVDVDGQVLGCVTFADSMQAIGPGLLRESADAMRLGDLRDRRLDARLKRFPEVVQAAGVFNRKHDKYSSYQRCAECEFFTECGVCPASIGHIPGNSDPDRIPDSVCAYNLVAHRYRQRFPATPDPDDIVSGRAPFMSLMREMQAAAKVARRNRWRPSDVRPAVNARSARRSS